MHEPDDAVGPDIDDDDPPRDRWGLPITDDPPRLRLRLPARDAPRSPLLGTEARATLQRWLGWYLIATAVVMLLGIVALPYWGTLPHGTTNPNGSRIIQGITTWRQYPPAFLPPLSVLAFGVCLVRDRWWRQVGAATLVYGVWWAWEFAAVLWFDEVPIGPGMVAIATGSLAVVVAVIAWFLLAQDQTTSNEAGGPIEALAASIGGTLLVVGWFRPSLESRLVHGQPLVDSRSAWRSNRGMLEWAWPRYGSLPLRFGGWVMPILLVALIVALVLGAWRSGRVSSRTRMLAWAGVAAALVLQQCLRLIRPISVGALTPGESRIEQRPTLVGLFLLLGSALAFVVAARLAWAAGADAEDGGVDETGAGEGSAEDGVPEPVPVAPA